VRPNQGNRNNYSLRGRGLGLAAPFGGPDTEQSPLDQTTGCYRTSPAQAESEDGAAAAWKFGSESEHVFRSVVRPAPVQIPWSRLSQINGVSAYQLWRASTKALGYWRHNPDGNWPPDQSDWHAALICISPEEQKLIGWESMHFLDRGDYVAVIAHIRHCALHSPVEFGENSS